MNTDFTDKLSPDARILDAGGWRIPFDRATHMVDRMPYETRTGNLNLAALPGECFSRDTWHQADFLDQKLKLPFPDKFFDFSVCGHTVEDLETPGPLLAELRRVSKAGYIETPSRLCEQTIGVRDRMTSMQGHPHHHWIVESENNQLLLSNKSLSLQGSRRRHALPLRTYERMIAGGAGSPVMQFHWQGDFEYRVLSASEATRRAKLLVESCAASKTDHVLDPIIRNLRKVKHGLLRSNTRETQIWWEKVLTLSRPYSKLPL